MFIERCSSSTISTPHSHYRSLSSADWLMYLDSQQSEYEQKGKVPNNLQQSEIMQDCYWNKRFKKESQGLNYDKDCLLEK